MSSRPERTLKLQADPVRVERRRPVTLPLPKDFDLRLVITNDPDALAAIRHALGGVAGALGMAPTGIADLRLALTEVCSAAMRRDAEVGDLEILAGLDGERLRVTIRGAASLAPSAGPDGFPLPLVAALTETLELRRAAGGSEVVMTFPLAA